MVAICGGKLLTVTQGVIEEGSLLIDNGKIADIGTALSIPKCAEKIDARGKWVTPGFIDVHTHISTFGEPEPRPAIYDGNEISSPNTCQLRGIDGTPVGRKADFQAEQQIAVCGVDLTAGAL